MAARPQDDVRSRLRRSPHGGCDWAEQRHGGRGERGRQMGHPGVPADHQPGPGHQRGQLAQPGAPGEHARRRQPGEHGHPLGEVPLPRAPGDHHLVPVPPQVRGHQREPLRRPAPGRVPGPGVDDDGPGLLLARGEAPEPQIGGVGRDAVPGEQVAPAPYLVHAVPPDRSARAGEGGVGVGQQPGRAGAVERGDAARAGAVQVDRDVHAPAERRYVTGPRHVAHLVHRADQRHQGRQRGRRGQHDPVAGVGAAQGAQGGDRGEQVTESQPAQYHHDRAVRLGPGGGAPPSVAGTGLAETHAGRSGAHLIVSLTEVRWSTASTTRALGTDDRQG